MAQLEQLYARAVALIGERQFEAAEVACREILKLLPNHPDTLNLQGLAQLRAGHHKRALTTFNRALKSNPRLTSIHLNIGIANFEMDQLADAKAAFIGALNVDPGSVEAHFQLAILAMRQFKFEEGVAHCRDALALQPDHAFAYAVMGEALVLLGRFDEARAALERANTLNPRILNVYDNLGMLAENEGRETDALAHFDKAISIDPTFAGSHFNRAVTFLRRGNFELGFAEYDWRWRTARTAQSTKLRPFTQPAWQGEKLVGGKLLLWGEQGVGDEIRLSALACDLRDRGVDVIVECDKRLVKLLARSLPGATVVGRTAPPHRATADSEIAFQSAMESALQFVRPTLDAFPKRQKYLSADPERTQAIREHLAAQAHGKPIIGLSWGSYNPQLSVGKTTSLATWSPLLQRDDASFVRLQKVSKDADAASLGSEARALLDRLGQFPNLDLVQDLDGLAALISACDLVISVSNTTAHLSGALGVPTWVLLPFGHFQPWYWLKNRTDSPWYPSVKLYRPKGFGEWDAMVAQAIIDLDAWTQSQR